MQLAMVGLGRMGANIVRRLMADDHECVVTDVDVNAVDELVAEGATGAHDVTELVEKLDLPRRIWLMVPVHFVDSLIDDLAPLLDPGDVIIDGGNSFYRHDLDRADQLAKHDLHYVDVGTSGGVYGLERGFCLMVGGEDTVVQAMAPLFDTISPSIDSVPRTANRSSEVIPAEHGWLHCGPAGAGHFVKMVHNGIEYGMMAAIAEGLGILEAADAGTDERQADAETAPLEDPRAYQYDFDIAAITELWRRGSVVNSWLIDLTANAYAEDPQLAQFAGRVSDSGMGRWTVKAAVDIGVPAHTITASLYERFASREKFDYASRALSAMRMQFGGHHEKPTEEG
ncbi:MAG: decarboxylating 6-phosphogluconate dehydrogenase [Acidimicrobiales bacterium]|nr:decarboxylating 6-phosphogluconate dehydrogenase [Acidimicrobiales bacterium]MDG1878303.1 decarboxylating 6-phosphogluconate dehydrogenase [Acidimicrobiales bacterium]